LQELKIIQENIELARKEGSAVCIWGAGYMGKGLGYDILKEMNIVPNYYCDNNEKLWGEEIIDGINCVNYRHIFIDKKNIVCFVFVANHNVNSVVNQLQELGICYYVTLAEMLSLPGVLSNFFPFMEQKIIAYTCIVGNYDTLMEPDEDIARHYDLYLISDKKPKQSVYKWIDIQDILPNSVSDPTRMNRYCKMNAHKIFPQYRRSIYYDGNILLKRTLDDCFADLKKAKIGIASPNQWSCIYEEAIRMIAQKRDIPERIVAQMKKYWLQGMPVKFGSCWCNVLIREHNHPNCIKLMEDWWQEVESESNRDQLSFPYVLWKNNYIMEDVLMLSKATNESPYWEFIQEHNVSRLINAKP